MVQGVRGEARLGHASEPGGFAGPLCCIASIQHARSLDTRGFSLSLSLKHE